MHFRLNDKIDFTNSEISIISYSKEQKKYVCIFVIMKFQTTDK